MKRETVYAVVTVLIWSTTAAVSKVLLTGLPNLQVLAVSSLLAFGFLLLRSALTGSLRRWGQYAPRDYAKMAGLGFVGLFAYSALYNYGLTVLTSQEACILNYLWPLMIVLFSCLILKEKLTALKLAAVGCSFAGIVLLSAGGGGALTGSRAAGMAACVLAAGCYGLFSVLNKKAGYDQTVAMTVIWLTTAVCSAALGLATEVWQPLSGAQWLGLLWLGVVINAVAYLLWALALNGAANTAAVANFAYLTPFLSLLVSAVFLREPLTARALLALGLIVGGILLQSLFDRKPA